MPAMQLVGCWHRRALEQIRNVHCSGAPASDSFLNGGFVGSLNPAKVARRGNEPAGLRKI
jgi:hypothetical protein